jgi:hypothetical protein
LRKIQNQRIAGFGFLKKNSKSKNHWVRVFENQKLKNRLFQLFTKSQRAGGFFKKVENHEYTSELGTWFFDNHSYISKPSTWFYFFENHRHQN